MQRKENDKETEYGRTVDIMWYHDMVVSGGDSGIFQVSKPIYYSSVMRTCGIWW
jgi:hypothetical protein